MISILLPSVKAEQEDFTIIVKDKDGKRLSNVAVEVYSKAVTVDASPAVKFNANGGKFLDGEEEMYFRIPYDGCSFGELMNYNMTNYLDSLLNFVFSYKNGYLNGDFVNSPEFFQNGDVLDLLWRPMESNAPIGDFDFKGEVLYFRGKKITELRSAIVFTVGMIINRIQNGDNYYIGDDTNSSCNIYDSNGLTPIEILLSPNQKYYLCWHNHPDGIYVNDTLFLGNVDSCFRQANLRYDSSINQVELRSRDSMNRFYLWSPNNSEMYFSPIIYQNSFLYRVMDDPNVIGSVRSLPFNFNSLSDIIGLGKDISIEMVDKIQIVENGETILTVNSSDFQTINGSSPSYIITNSSINSRVYEYIGRLAYNNCFN